MIAKKIQRFLAKLVATAMLFSIVTPLAMLARADSTGLVTVSTNLAEGSYTIRKLDGTVVGLGSGTNPTQHTLDASTMPGTGYSITFGAVAGFRSPDPNPVYFNLVQGANLTFGPNESGSYRTGIYTSDSLIPSGTVYVSTNLADGTYSIYSATDTTNSNPMGNGSGVASSQFVLTASATPGTGYKIVFGNVTGFTKPTDYFFNLVENASLTLGPTESGSNRTGIYTPIGQQNPTGTVHLYTNIAAGSYTIYSASDTGNTAPKGTGGGLLPILHNLDASPTPGTGYKIVFGNVSGFVTPQAFFFNLLSNQDVTFGPNEGPSYRTGLYTPIGQGTQETVYVRTTHPSGSYRIFPAASTMPIGNGGGVSFQPFMLDASVAPGTAYRISFDAVNGLITPSDILFSLIANDPLNPPYHTGVYRLNSTTGSVVVDVVNQNNQPINDGNWELKSCTSLAPSSCISTIGTGGPANAFPDLAPGIYRVFANPATGYQSVEILTENPHTLITGEVHTFLIRYHDQNSGLFADPTVSNKAVSNATPAPGDTVTYTVNYGNLGTISATNVLLVDDYDEANLTISALSEPSCTDTGTEIQCAFASLAAGSALNFTYQATVGASATNGTVINNIASILSADSNADTNNDSASRSAIVTVAATGTVNVTQVGALGTIDLVGPSPANFATATYTNIAAGVGSYTLTITAPAGFNLVDVRDGSNAVLAFPYTQTLTNGGTIDYTVNYAPVTTSGTINVTQNGAVGTLDLAGPSPANITTATFTNLLAGTGNYTLAITAPAGFVLVDVRDGANNALTTPYTQTLADGATIDYTVNYAPVTTSGTINVTQNGAVGTLDLAGPSPANITTATYTNGSAGVGSYTIAVTAPAGFNLVDVRDGANNVLTAPYTQALADGATIDYTVNYAPVTTSGTINVTQNGAVGTLDLAGPSPANITTATYTNGTAGTGAYTLAVTAPAGFVLVDVRDASNTVLAFPYSQTLTDGGTIDYTVNYAPVTTSGTVNVTQAGATGILNLLGPSPANITTATYTNASAGTGDYTLNGITAPAGFNLVDVRDGANNVIAAPYTQTLATGGTVTYTVNYAPVTTSGTVNVSQVGAVGTVDLAGPSPASVTTATYTNGSAGVGSYTIAVTAPAGFNLVDVRDASNTVLAFPYTQTLADGATIDYTVNYAPVTTSGTVNVNQVGATGTLNLLGPSPANVTTATYTNASAGTGDYTLNGITAPAGFNLVDVRDGANNVIAAPYTQTLATGGTVTYTVNYAVAPTTGTVNVNQTGAVGTVDLAGPSPASVTTATYTNASAGTGAYTLAVTVPAGFVLVDVRDASNTSLSFPYSQNLTTGGTVTYTVNYTAVTTSGTINVSQVGVTGTVNLLGPSPANVTTATYTNASAGTGVYTINITTPAGFNLVDVRDGANNVIAAPYTQTLAMGGTVTYTVNYAPAGGPQPDPTVSAFTLAPGSATPMAGNTISYLISYSNLSATTAATGVTIDVNYDETHGTITLPAGCVDNTPVAGTMRCTVADLAASATANLVFNYTINAGVALGANLVQVATISGSNGNSNATNDSRTSTIPVVGAYTLTKTANTASAGDNAIVTYTITAIRNSNAAGPFNVTISDTVTGTGTINGASGGTLVYVLNSGTCTGVTCSGVNINTAPITVTLDNPGSTATITYQARAVGGAIVGASSAATNSATGVSALLPNVNASAIVTMFPPSSSGSTGTSSGSGSGGGGYKPIKGEMKLDIKKLVSTDGVNFKEPAAGKNLAIAVPENKSTRLYNKVLVTNLGSVSAIDIQFRHFFDSGKSDMTADEIQNLTGATVSSKLGLLVVDKVKVGETLSFTYSILVHENGQNLNPAVDGLELVSYGSNLSTVQDALTYLGLGSQYKTFLYAGRVPANADVTIGNTVPGTDVPNGTGIGDILSINLRADKPIANVGDTLTFTLTVKNVTSDDLTNLFLDHTFDPNAFEVADAFGAKFDGSSIHWTRPLLRPGEQATYSFDLRVKDSAPVGELVHGLTQALVNEYEGIAPFENVIRIGAAGTTFQLAQTGPASTLALLLILSALASLGYFSLRRGLYLRTKKLALQEI